MRNVMVGMLVTMWGLILTGCETNKPITTLAEAEAFASSRGVTLTKVKDGKPGGPDVKEVADYSYQSVEVSIVCYRSTSELNTRVTFVKGMFGADNVVVRDRVAFYLMGGEEDEIRKLASCLQGKQFAVSDATPPAKEPAKLVVAKSDANRVLWSNTSYNSQLHHIKGKNWEEFDNQSGELKFHLTETSRTDEYIELKLLERDQLYRVYPLRLELLKDGKWGWLSNGKWESEK